jgi:hypothetical protein
VDEDAAVSPEEEANGTREDEAIGLEELATLDEEN